MKKPVPFNEDKDPDIFWKTDPFDKFIPKRKSFITDCIYRFRGTEIPTIYTIWTMLTALSITVKREAWIDFGYMKKFANLYVILVGPPGLPKKSTAMDRALDLLEDFPKHINDDCIHNIKQFVHISNQITPEALVNALGTDLQTLPGGSSFPLIINNKAVLDEHDVPIIYKRPNEQLIEVSELGVLLSKQSYMESMVTLLTDLYDNKKKSSKKTVGGNDVVLRNLYTCFLGATTPDGFRLTIPKVARGDGFLTRTIIVYSAGGVRRFPFPEIPKGAPSDTELAKRLAWIAQNVTGEYVLTKEAKEFYKEWYYKAKQLLVDDPERAGVNSRMDHNLMKIALLIRASQYEVGRDITLEDMQEAEMLLRCTMAESMEVVDTISIGEYSESYNKIKKVIEQKAKISRRELLRVFSGRARQQEIDDILNRLLQEQKIEVRNIRGGKMARIGPQGDDMYVYIY